MKSSLKRKIQAHFLLLTPILPKQTSEKDVGKSINREAMKEKESQGRFSHEREKFFLEFRIKNSLSKSDRLSSSGRRFCDSINYTSVSSLYNSFI
jgi:hypothetical protein